jgi:hypothetical protein
VRERDKKRAKVDKHVLFAIAKDVLQEHIVFLSLGDPTDGGEVVEHPVVEPPVEVILAARTHCKLHELPTLSLVSGMVSQIIQIP